MQGLVAEGVRAPAEARPGQVVQPVGGGVVRHRGPGQRGAGGERGAGGQRGPAPSGAPQQGCEQQQGGLEGGGHAGQHAGGPRAAYDEQAEQDQQHRQDARLAEPQGVADRQRQHEQADRYGCGGQTGASGDRLGQGPGGDDAERGDQQQGAEGPAPAEGLFGRPGEGLEHQAAERGAGEPGGVVQGAVDVQDARGADPGLQIGQAPAARAGQDGRDLAGGEEGRDQPQEESEGAQARPGRADSRRSDGSRRSSAVFGIRHAFSTLSARRRTPSLRLTSTPLLSGKR